MARSASGVAALSASLAESITLLVSRRGYAAASATGVGSRARTAEQKAVAAESSSSSSAAASASSNSWVPDPATGYYRPGNQRVQKDAAELRAMLLPGNH
ncbi:hypothetical protein Cni_G20965 [Canna indica]|uniref:Late embryogenesis abundant protein Lea5 n=1 Tax=Canna indica TaxID=4628 RepID=A0AAQ3KQ22_9LILI|nr:hypothetical protein Cni_G20965 [Canna indica]